MAYTVTADGFIQLALSDDSAMFLPPENNGTPEWRAYQDWLDEGNEPAPYIPPSPGPDYMAFWDALLVSSVYQSIRSQALTNPAVLVACTEFIAAISDAKAGRANVPAIQACINYLLGSGTFTEAELDEVATLLEAGNLQGVYTISPPAP